ncbi:MAG: hypothetical protein M3506_03115 [Chloroflexota bacterium]|nr:hypothetical protein [Chloroflexota bacterium]
MGDGAQWIWGLARWHFPQAVRVLDLWHAKQRLWALASALYGEGDARVVAWVEGDGSAKGTSERLAGGEGAALLAEWETLEPADPVAWAEHLTYCRNQQDRMRYGEYREAGLPVGSAVVESANRHLVGVRVKQAGMRR